jgi:ribulose kinase
VSYQELDEEAAKVPAGAAAGPVRAHTACPTQSGCVGHKAGVSDTRRVRSPRGGGARAQVEPGSDGLLALETFQGSRTPLTDPLAKA